MRWDLKDGLGYQKRAIGRRSFLGRGDSIEKLCNSGTSDWNLGGKVGKRDIGQIMEDFECQEHPNSLGWYFPKHRADSNQGMILGGTMFIVLSNI